ncbi:MAG: DUF2304 domain-containing protein [Patescibacteria group bacterium]|jgi:hypothetical protein
MVSGIQIIGVLFGLVLSYFTYLAYKRTQFTIREYLGWQTIWVCFVLVTLYPNMFQVFSSNLGTARAFDLFSVLGFTVVLGISFYTYVNLDRLRKTLEKTIRDLSLREIDDNKKTKKN